MIRVPTVRTEVESFASSTVSTSSREGGRAMGSKNDAARKLMEQAAEPKAIPARALNPSWCVAEPRKRGPYKRASGHLTQGADGVLACKRY